MTKLYDDYQMQAVAGMKADSGFDRVETLPAKADIAFGAVVGFDAGKGVAGKGERAVGIALHTHTHIKAYQQYDAVSVMTRGLVWAKVADGKTVAQGEAVKFDANGLLDNTASDELPNALVRGTPIFADGSKIVLIELHAPTA